MQKNVVGLAVISAVAGIVGNAATKLRPDHNQHFVADAFGRQIVVKGFQTFAQGFVQRRQVFVLIGVRVVTALADVINARSQLRIC